jgi:hypothetical protein
MNMRHVLLALFYFALMNSQACTKKIDVAAEKQKILNIMEASDRELLSGVVPEDSNDTAQDYETISIMKGNLERVSRSEVRARLKGLLARESFTDIKNLEGPIISISPDGNMAWMAVKTKISMTYIDSLGRKKTWDGIEARLEVYEKRDNRWIEIAGAQTFQ